jgi:hypothetical protein
MTMPDARRAYSDAENYRDSDGDNGLPDGPAMYEGPAVPEQAPLVNPSAGTTGPAESGSTDINPVGATPTPGTAGLAGQQAPDNPGQRGTTGYGR